LKLDIKETFGVEKFDLIYTNPPYNNLKNEKYEICNLIKNLKISEYYQIIKQKLESNDYTTSNPRDINAHLEAINYLQWEFMSDRKDPKLPSKN
jgi:DNA modification methylase